jgi:hypothetical protein
MAVANEPRMSTEKVADVEKGSAATASAAVAIKEEDIQYPEWRKLVLIMIALYLCMFLVALVWWFAQSILVSLLILTRIELLLELLFPKSQTTSKVLVM